MAAFIPAGSPVTTQKPWYQKHLQRLREERAQPDYQIAVLARQFRDGRITADQMTPDERGLVCVYLFEHRKESRYA